MITTRGLRVFAGARGRWSTVTLTATMAGAFLGCPSLSEIGVGGGDSGTDAGVDARADRTSDVAPRDVHSSDATTEVMVCTTDAASDPKNCGSCGHDCMGGACQGGLCQPYAIVTGANGPYGVAVAKGIVYFTSPGDQTVETCMADDCIHTLTQMTSGQQSPHVITTDPTTVYWANAGFGTDGGSIATCGLAGCPEGMSSMLAAGEQGPFDLAVDTSSVYWTNEFGHLVRACSIGGAGMPRTLVTDPAILSGVAVDATSIYWAEPKLGNIIKCPLTGCASFAPFASFPPSQTVNIDIADGTVFWTTNGAIMSCAASGCVGAPTVVANGQPFAYAITHDATYLYWTLFANAGQVLRCPLSGCTTPTVLAVMQNLPSSVAVDDTSVYWANSGGTTVMRLMK